MKKQKIKTFLKLGTLLFGISLFLVACQKDDDLQTNTNLFPKKYSPFSITKIGEAEIFKNKALSNKLNKLTTTIAKNRTASLENRTIYSSEYDFYIDTEQANFIQIDSTYHSYTFTIKRDYATSIIENLLVSLQQDGSYKMLFVTYNTTNQEKNDIINDINVDLIDKVQYTIIDDDILMSNIFGKIMAGGDCVVMAIGPCNNGYDDEHGPRSNGNGGNCTGSTNEVNINLDCMGGGGGFETTGYGAQIPNYGTPSTGNNGHGGNGTGTGNNPNITVPTPCTRDCPEMFDLIPDPCDTLKNATDDQNIQTAITNVKPQTESKIEFAYEIERRYNYNNEEFDYTTILKAGSNFNTNVQVGGHVQGQVHNHPKNGLPIPSWGDIRWTYQCEDNNTNKNNSTAYNIVVVKNPEMANSTITYAVTINDFNALGTQIDYEMNQPKVLKETDTIKKLDIINKKIGKEFKSIDDDANALEKKFLEVHANYGISLFKKNEQTNKWEKLKLENPFDPNNPNASNTVTTEPCNN